MPDTGPHVAVAVLCERVITEGDGVLSLIRIVDRVTQSATGPDPPDLMPAFIVDNLQMVLALKSDQARGRHRIKLVIEDPSTTRTPVTENDVNLSPGNQGINVVIPVKLGLELEGVYWIDVILSAPRGQEDKLMTRVPIEVVYQRQRVPVEPDQSES